MASGVKAIRRSTTFKQFLLRVHPDHFRTIPKVHDENLVSMQLLNQYMDEQHAYASSYHHHHERKRIFFSAYVPASETTEQQQLKRFRLDLATNIEDHMKRILRECGVDEPRTSSEPHVTVHEAIPNDDTWDMDAERYTSTPRGGMDFGSSANFAHYAHTRRRKRPILSLQEFLAFVDEPSTRQKQQQVRTAWESIKSVKRTLVREFGLGEIATSCGWASVPLNKTLMSLLKTLRKLKHSIDLHDVRIDVRADASEIDYFDEYTIVLNVADVPLQWVEILETIDAKMLKAIHSAHASLEQLQHAAERALGGAITIKRGRTCSAIAYRGFLQDVVVTAPIFVADPVRADGYGTDDAIIEQFVIVVEDSVRECEIQDDGKVRAPSCASAAHVLEFVDTHRMEIREQVMDYDTQREQFEFIATQCISVLGLESLTYSDTLRLRDVNRASAKLLAFATDGNRYGSSSTTELLQGAQKKAFRFDRYFGLAQDGVFTLPTEWF